MSNKNGIKVKFNNGPSMAQLSLIYNFILGHTKWMSGIENTLKLLKCVNLILEYFFYLSNFLCVQTKQYYARYLFHISNFQNRSYLNSMTIKPSKILNTWDWLSGPIQGWWGGWLTSEYSTRMRCKYLLFSGKKFSGKK